MRRRRPLGLVRLPAYLEDTAPGMLDPRRRALLVSAVRALALDPEAALDLFPVKAAEGVDWTEYVLAFPPRYAGELRFEVDHGEGLLVLKRCRFEEP